MNVNKPIDKIFIGNNKSNEEYIELAGEKNKIKKGIEMSREHKEKKRIQEKEQGFNIHINGANEERIREQKRQELLNKQKIEEQPQKVRRMWKNPNSVEGRQEEQKYQNPVSFLRQIFQFDLGQAKNPLEPQFEDKSPSRPRKRWEGNSNKPTKGIHNLKGGTRDEEEDYSDSFEEIQQDEDLEDEANESGIKDEYAENQGPSEIEQFLRTATQADINNLKQSLSNFGELTKQFNRKDAKKEAPAVEEEYIEEDFEEHIESEEEGEDSDDERKQVEKLREEQLRQQQLRNQQMLQSSQNTRSTKNRPISATYNLVASQKIQPQKAPESQMQLIQPTQNLASVRDLKPQQNFISNYTSSQAGISQLVQETPKQPNDVLKKPLNTNPFKRPFSQNVPKRPEASSSGYNSNSSAAILEPVKEIQPFKTNEPVTATATQKIPMQNILQRIELLDEWQKEKLLEILNNLECQPSAQTPSKLNVAEKQQPSQNLDLKFLSPSKQQQSQAFNAKDKTDLRLRFVKTYGNPHLCGLTEIEVYDSNSKKIQLVPGQIIPLNLGNGPKIPVARLIDGHKLTNDEKHMWIGFLPARPKQLEIQILLNKDQDVGAIKLWNYNKSSIESVKGVKELQVLLNGAKQWEGLIQPGKGQVNIEYATVIPLREGIFVPKEIQDPIEEQYEEEESKDQIQEEMRKFKSEAAFSQGRDNKASNAPIWLSDQEKLKQKQTEQNTLNLLEKNSQVASTDRTSQASDKTSQQSKKAQSALGAARPHPLREQSKGISSQTSTSQLSQGSQNSQIKPNAALSSVQSANRPIKATYDLNEQVASSNQKQWTQPFSVQKQAYQDTTNAIQQAVNKVNQVVSMQNQRPRQVKVEESLDNLDFFKATNRGRLFNISDQPEEQQIQKEQPIKNERSQRTKWGQSPSKVGGLQESQLSGGKHKAHVVVKNPFPENPIPSGGTRNSSRKSERQSQHDGGDILDQFLNQQPSASQKKESTHFLQYQSSMPLAEQKQSISPQRVEVPSKPVIKTQSYDERLLSFASSFTIPTLPKGQRLHFNILSTWGDMNYVGLTGIEVFDIEGKHIQISGDNITACPPDINILPGYGGDPRTVDKLVDGHYLTNDDLHVWLTPFTAGEDHTITLDMGSKRSVAMIRVWNYNKSRIHSYRGARLIDCQLDSQTIFRGELQKAPGTLNDPESCCEIILFTENEAILQRIDFNDWINDQVVVSEMENTQRILQDVPSYLEERPMTATKKFNTAEMQEIQRQLRQQKPTSLFDERPQTSAIITGDQEEFKVSSKNKEFSRQQELSNQVRQMATQSQSSVRGRVIELNILETWGDLFYVGFNGLEVLDERGEPLRLSINMIDANPRDMNSIPGHGSDYRTLDKLINGVNNTMDDHHMWLVPFNKGENHTLKIDLGKTTNISGLKFFNYNKSEEDTLRGAKLVTIQIDKKFVTPKKGITIRKAPGLVDAKVSIGQMIRLPYKQGWTTDQMIPLQRKREELGMFQEYDLLHLPMGLLFRINLYSTHGDFYYIGLNGIELFDQNGSIIKITTIFAEPEGIHKIQGMESDVRVVKNLINGVNQTSDDTNMWLAPFKNTRSYSAVTNSQKDQDSSENQTYRIPNFVYIMFDQPTAVSAIRIWNYSKTPARGVNEFELLIDDKQVYRGFAKRAPEKGAASTDFSTVVLFTTESKIVDRFKNNINYDVSKQQDVSLYCDKKLMNKSTLKQRPTEEFVVFNDQQRPTTMAKAKY